MASADNVGQQFAMMRPSELLPYAKDRSDKYGQAKVNVLAESIGEHGYRQSKMRGNRAPITLSHTDRTSELTEGNHRVHAMAKVGYDRPVRVRVTDERTNG